MAGTGPAPKAQRRRRNADTFADVQTHVAAPAQSTAPTFAQAVGALADGLAWPDGVRALVVSWWETWRTAPQAVAFLRTDWQRLAMLAPLVADYFTRPHHMKLAEIRQNEALLGATHVDRLRARIKVEMATPDTGAVPADVAVMDEYRARLSG